MDLCELLPCCSREKTGLIHGLRVAVVLAIWASQGLLCTILFTRRMSRTTDHFLSFGRHVPSPGDASSPLVSDVICGVWGGYVRARTPGDIPQILSLHMEEKEAGNLLLYMELGARFTGSSTRKLHSTVTIHAIARTRLLSSNRPPLVQPDWVVYDMM